jgi:hypothetical protein
MNDHPTRQVGPVGIAALSYAGTLAVAVLAEGIEHALGAGERPVSPRVTGSGGSDRHDPPNEDLRPCRLPSPRGIVDGRTYRREQQ